MTTVVSSEQVPQQDQPVADAVYRREIKSFVRREGRVTQGQARALETLWPVYGIEFDASRRLDFNQVFGNDNPVWLEIGFGMGKSLAEMAQLMPQVNFLGIEVHRPGVGSLLNDIQEQGITNIRIMSHDAVEVLKLMLPELSLARVLLFFPDPWHKTKHHKRRIVQPDFLKLVSSRLAGGGVFHAATDWQPYAEWMLEMFAQVPIFDNTAGVGQYAVKPDYRPETKFERRGIKLGHGVWDLVFEKPDYECQ
jgi:tRNA (guanine-N7-)-methyltransferase